MRIDVHTHFFPEEYQKVLQEVIPPEYELAKDASGQRIMKYRGARFVTFTHQMTSPTDRIAEMDAAGVDVQAISLSTPSVYHFDEDTAVRVSRKTNEILCSVRDQYPTRFMTLATVPLNNPERAIEELRYSINELGMNGVLVGSNINGRPLDAPELVPFWAEVDRLRLAVLIHPMPPVGAEIMGAYGLAPLVGFIFDSTLAVTRMAFAGLFERFQQMNLIVPHLGSAIPYIWRRIESGTAAYPDCRVHIEKPATEYFKRLYYDTVSFHIPSLRCAYDTVGPAQIVFGTDYPHVIGSNEEAVASVDAVARSEEEREMILSGNALKILRRS